MNEVLSECARLGHEEVCFFGGGTNGLRAIIAVHNTKLGPAIGGCRMRVYADEGQAIQDVLRLSEGMTYKNALAGIPHGGAKACIIADKSIAYDRTKLFQEFGECVNRLGGRYITAEDMGTGVADIMVIKGVSPHVVGTDPARGGGGDPSPWTALGVFSALQAAFEHKFNTDDLSGKTIAVQGVGHVGRYLTERLVNAGANVIVTDTNKQSVDEVVKTFKVKSVGPDEIYDTPCDVFAPCAVGQTVSPATLKRLTCSIIAGGANNQLSDSSVYKVLAEKNILYCPDFVINAGGVICVAAELDAGGWTEKAVSQRASQIRGTTKKILEEAITTKEPTEVVALRHARQIVNGH